MSVPPVTSQASNVVYLWLLVHPGRRAARSAGSRRRARARDGATDILLTHPFSVLIRIEPPYSSVFLDDVLCSSSTVQDRISPQDPTSTSASGGLNIAYLELLDSNIGPEGCKVLGETLKTHTQPGLLTINLEYNRAIGDAGVTIAPGLLRHWTRWRDQVGTTREYSQQRHRDAVAPGQFVGRRWTLPPLARSATLVTLNLSDNSTRHSTEALTALRDALTRAKALAHIDFTFNHIEIDGANILLPALAPENTKIQSFQVDASLPGDLFTLLNRAPKADGKKKGGSKKKK
ncbi:hypothetical protein FI667_g4095, partial [Globisporangium splendens]